MSSFARSELVKDWWPVVVLPPIMVADALLTSDPSVKPVTVVSVLASFVACLPLVARRHLSFAWLVVPVTAGVALEVWALAPSSTLALIPMVGLLELAIRGDRRRSLIMAVSVVPCVVVVVLLFPHGSLRGDLSVFARNLAMCVIAIIAGDWLRVRREAAQRTADAAAEQALRRIGEERLQIAHEIHDVVAHAMTAINVQAGVAAHLVDRDPTQAHDALREIKRTSGEALTELRGTLNVLREPGQRAPLGPAGGLHDLEPLAAGLRSAGVDVDLDVDPVADLPASVHSTGYRIVQEALTNVARHAQASRAWVRVRRELEAITIEVADDGRGLPAAVGGPGASPTAGGPGASPPAAGNGLRGMAERAAALGGAVVVQPREAGGWLVRASLPLADDRVS